jgi:hypothetical protein
MPDSFSKAFAASSSGGCEAEPAKTTTGFAVPENVVEIDSIKKTVSRVGILNITLSLPGNTL